MSCVRVLFASFILLIAISRPLAGGGIDEFFFELNPRVKDLDGWFFNYPPEAELYQQLEVVIPLKKELLYLEFECGSSSFDSLKEIDEHIAVLATNAKKAAAIALKNLPEDAQVYFVSLESDHAEEAYISIFGEIIAKNGEIIGASVYTVGEGDLRFGEERKFEMGGLIEFGPYEN